MLGAMTRCTALAPMALVALALTGCSSGPSADEFADRFTIEYESASGLDLSSTDSGEKLALEAAESAIDGMCGELAYRYALEDSGIGDDYLYAWDVSCLMYFEGDMSQAQIDRAKAALVERATSGLDD